MRQPESVMRETLALIAHGGYGDASVKAKDALQRAQDPQSEAVKQATRQIIFAACGSDTMLNVTHIDTPDDIEIWPTGETMWARTADVAKWLRGVV